MRHRFHPYPAGSFAEISHQACVVQLLVERVDVSPDGVDIRLRTEGLSNLTAELDAVRPEQLR